MTRHLQTPSTNNVTVQRDDHNFNINMSKRIREDSSARKGTSSLNTGFVKFFVGDFLGTVLRIFVSVISLGIAAPWMLAWHQKRKMSNVSIDGASLYFTGRGIELFKMALVAFIPLIALPSIAVLIASFIEPIKQYVASYWYIPVIILVLFCLLYVLIMAFRYKKWVVENIHHSDYSRFDFSYSEEYPAGYRVYKS